MSYKIAIASGKGGTGKTTVSANLFHHFSQHTENRVMLVDCDVEEPNDMIFFPQATKIKENSVEQLIPEINHDKCTYCRKCAEYCEFNAIVVIPHVQFAEVNASLCHSCGACSVACKFDAITEKPQSIGEAVYYETEGSNRVLEGKLKIGSTMQTMLIGEIKKMVTSESDIVIYDAPPGTSCPVVETISDVDYIILVTEPTPFGFHDLKIMMDLLKEVKKPFGVVVNKTGMGNDEVYQYIEKEKIELLGKIPFMEQYAVSYSKGDLFENIPKEIRDSYEEMVETIQSKLFEYAGNNHIER